MGMWLESGSEAAYLERPAEAASVVAIALEDVVHSHSSTMMKYSNLGSALARQAFSAVSEMHNDNQAPRSRHSNS